MPLISFVIPLYNKENYITGTLKSIVESCNQQNDFNDYEIIVIDDGSKDDSCQQVQNFIETTKANIRLVRQLNAGPSVARNNGIALAIGKYISFIDADDIVLPLYIEFIRYVDRHYHDNFVFSTGFKKIDQKNIHNSHEDTFDIEKIGVVDDFFGRWLTDKFCYTSSITINRNFLLEKGIRFPEGYHSGEDQYVWFNLATLTPFVHLNQIGIAYMQQVEGQLSSKRPLEIEIHVKKLAELERKALTKKGKKALSVLLNSEYFYLIINNLLIKQRKDAICLITKRPAVVCHLINILKIGFALIAPNCYNALRNNKDTCC